MDQVACQVVVVKTMEVLLLVSTVEVDVMGLEHWRLRSDPP